MTTHWWRSRSQCRACGSDLFKRRLNGISLLIGPAIVVLGSLGPTHAADPKIADERTKNAFDRAARITFFAMPSARPLLLRELPEQEFVMSNVESAPPPIPLSPRGRVKFITRFQRPQPPLDTPYHFRLTNLELIEL